MGRNSWSLHSLSIQFILLEQCLKKFDMIDVFTIQLYGPYDPTDVEAPKQKNLLPIMPSLT